MHLIGYQMYENMFKIKDNLKYSVLKTNKNLSRVNSLISIKIFLLQLAFMNILVYISKSKVAYHILVVI